ncbi:hypothetical protein [Treponema berlinense]|uniref:hypothetical protein n=2 Tax=Treponema berlinense TaxID=225004 RepID=UPI002352240F|nr:hypothetical protein [Treponema berlinense]
MPIRKGTIITDGEKAMKMIKKLSSTAIAFIFTLTELSAAASFNGYGGLKGDLKSKEDSEFFDPIMNLTGFFQGQFNFSENLFFNTEMSISTDDVIDTKLTEDTRAVFCFDELSLTYVKNFLGATQFFSIFKGTYTPLGANQFLSQQFGISPVNSFITDSFYGNKCASPYSINGLGLSYSIRLNSSPMAFAGYFYKNNDNPDGLRQFNLDFRFATVRKYLTLDVLGGIGLPSKNKDKNDNDVILLVDEVYLHSGMNLLIGNYYTSSLFLQAGFSSLPVKKSNAKIEISDEQIFLLVEPRFHFKNSQMHISFFNIPAGQNEKMEFADGNLGFNINIFTENFFIRNKNIKFGFSTSFSYEERYLKDLQNLKDFYKDTCSVKTSPYLVVPVLSGDLSLMFQAKLSEFPAGKWKQNINFTLGYKSYF